MLLYVLIGLFVSLLLYQIYLDLFKQPLIEGLENSDVPTTTDTTQEQASYQPYNLKRYEPSLLICVPKQFNSL